MPVQKAHKTSKLSEHTVAELRKMAKKAGVKQTTSSGHTKTKAQLVSSLTRK